MKQQKKQKNGSTQRFTGLKNIIDTVALFEDGFACMILQIQATNFSLLSYQEQEGKIYAYASLLNSLSFPIEILIRSKRIDISSYVAYVDEQYKASLKSGKNEGLTSYILLYKNFVQELVQVNTVLDKNFYLVLPYSYLEKGASGAVTVVTKGGVDEQILISSAKTALETKATALLSQITKIGLRAILLSKEELIKLFYDVYNQEVSSSGSKVETSLPIVVQGRK